MTPKAIAGAVDDTAEAVEQLYQSKSLRRLLRPIWGWISGGELNVAVFGAGGVGKTTLGKLLNGTLSHTSARYAESMFIAEVKLKGDNINCTLIIAPGQTDRIPATWPQLFGEIQKAKHAAIINVVAYGYHSLGDHTDTESFRKAGGEAKFLETYLRDCRELEVQLLDKIYTGITEVKGGSLRELRMLTVVTKQDLWWKDRAVVLKHYKNGHYHTLIEKIHNRLGDRFHHEYTDCSLIAANWKADKYDRMFASTAEGYDIPTYFKNIKVLVNRFETLTGGATD